MCITLIASEMKHQNTDDEAIHGRLEVGVSPSLSSMCQTMPSSFERDLNSTTFNRRQINGLVSGLH